MYFTQQDGTFQLFDGDKIAVLAALLLRHILNDLQLPAESIKVSLSCLSFLSWSLILCTALNFIISRQARGDCINFGSVMLGASPLAMFSCGQGSSCTLSMYQLMLMCNPPLQTQSQACLTANLMSTCGCSLMYRTAYPTATSTSNCPAEVLFMGFIALDHDLFYNSGSWGHDVLCDFGS